MVRRDPGIVFHSISIEPHRHSADSVRPRHILDVFSRYVVGWMMAEQESKELAEVLIETMPASRN